MSQIQWRNVLQIFCRNVLWLPWQSTRRLSGRTGFSEEHMTRRKEHDKVFPIEDNFHLMSHGSLKYPSRRTPKFTIVHFKAPSPLPSSLHINIRFRQRLMESRQHK